MSQLELAAASGVGIATIRDFERGKRHTIAANIAALRTALESEGVVFLADGELLEGGAGVRLRG